MRGRARLGTAIAAWCTGAAFVYALLRVLQVWLMPEPDPALVLWSEHSGFFWRAWTAAHASVIFAFLAWLAPERAARVLPTAVIPLALVAFVQALLVP